MLVSSLGDWVGFVAVTVLVTHPDIGGGNAAFAVSGVMIARLLPSIVFGPFAGVLVDRFDRKKLMVTADVVRGVAYASMPFLPSLLAIYVLSFVIESFSLVWNPARDASIPKMVPRRQLANANTLGLATTYGTLPLGGVVFTALAALSGGLDEAVPFLADRPEALALWLDGLTFAFSAWMIWGIALPRQSRVVQPGAAGAVSDFREGVRYLRDHAFVRAMTIGIVLAFLGVGAVIGVGPVFASRTLGAGPSGWGVLVTSVGIGLGIGMASLNWIQRFVAKHVLFPLAMLATAGTGVLLSLMPSLTPAALATVLTGAAAGITWVTGYTLLHENISDELRGRTFGTVTLLSRLGLFVALAGFPALAGWLGDRSIELGATSFQLTGTRVALWVGSGIVLAGGLLSRRGLLRTRLARLRPLALRPRLRKVDRRGAFIVFEGVEGSGKGTQIRLAREFLESQGLDVMVTREPGGTNLGERLRAAVLDPEAGSVEPRAEALLFAASRAQHVAHVIRPALEAGKVVVCDRYVDSSLAYQGVARGLGEQDVLSLNAWATQGLFPDLTILLNIEPDEGLARAGEERDRIEGEDPSFHAKVAEAYLHIAEEHPERFVVIDAGTTAEMVHGKVREALDRFLKSETE